MRCAVKIVIVFITQADAQDATSKLIDKLVGRVPSYSHDLVDTLVDNSVDDYFKPGVSGRRHESPCVARHWALKGVFRHHLDKTILGKPGHGAIPSGNRPGHQIQAISRDTVDALPNIKQTSSPTIERTSQSPLSAQGATMPLARRHVLISGLVPMLLAPHAAKASFGSPAAVQSVVVPSRAKQLLEELRRQEGQLKVQIEDAEKAIAQTTDMIAQQIGVKEQDPLKKELEKIQKTVRDTIAAFERNQKLEARLAKRAATLAALEAQPDWFNYVAAFAASCVSTLIMHPVDTLKTREVVGEVRRTSPLNANATPTMNLVDALATRQVAGEASEISQLRANSTKDVGVSVAATSVVANGTAISELSKDNFMIGIRTMRSKMAQIPKDWTLEGYLSLYQGISGALLKEGPPSALYLGVYEAVKTQLLGKPNFAPYPLLVYLIAGAVGESVGSVIRAPAEAIKARVQSGIDSSTSESFQRVLFDGEGRANVARAWSASLWRDVPFGAIQLAIFEGLKSFIEKSFVDIDVNTLTSEVLFGALGGAIGSFLTVPMDVVTTRIITQECDEKARDQALDFFGMTKKVWAEGGWRTLLTGWQARTGYWAPAIGIFLSCYSSIREAAIAQNLFK